MHLIRGGTADELWMQAAQLLVESPDHVALSGRGAATDELQRVQFLLEDPRQRWVTCRQPGINPAFAVAELVWILNGRQDSAFLNFWNARLPEYAGRGEIYHGAYGYRLRRHFGLDQLQRAAQVLRANPSSRQVALQLYDPASDLPDESGRPQNPDIPCNVASMLKIRNGRLDWTQVMRSNDLFRGTPYNLIQFTVLQEVLAGWIGVEIGTYAHYADSLHVYGGERHRLTPLDKVPLRTELILSLPERESRRVWKEMERGMEALSDHGLTLTRLEAALQADVPDTYRQLLQVAAVQVAWKRDWKERSQTLVQDLADPALRVLSTQWVRRKLTGTLARTEL